MGRQVKVVVGMSGGVDSSVAAALLKEQGCQVSGVTMRIWGGDALLEEGKHHACYGPGEEEDIEDARKVCQALDIPFYVLDLREEYKAEVLDYYCREYFAGRTPNPCVRCNRTVKFGALLDKTLQSGIEFDYFATGHYARVEYSRGNRRYLLKRAKDLSRDQSYFLSFLSQEQFRQVLLPVGDHTKAEIRRLAADFGLDVSSKPDSQDFIAGGYRALFGAELPGPILDRRGNILGEHQGISSYTIGQRKRLGISGREPLYVVDIDPERNAVIVDVRAGAYRDELFASGLNWIAMETPEQTLKVEAKIRNNHPGAEAKVIPLDGDRVRVRFEQPQLAITPGQAVVFYQGDTVVGAGTIERTRE